MRKPFYEEDFNVEKYVNNRILEMDSISDRILYKQMAESFMIDLFDMTRKEISKISKSVIDELERKEEKVEIYTSVIENSKYDKTDTFLCPIYETEKRKDIDIVKIQETLSNGELYCLDSIYIKEKYSKLIQIKENNTFDGKIETTEGIYDAVFEINFDNRCLNKLKEIYNAVMYNTLCIAHLIRMYTLSIKEIKSDNVKGDFVKYKIDYKKLNVLEDIIPLWNIWEVKDLHKSVNHQHINSSKKDLAHEWIGYAIFSADTLSYNFLDGSIGSLNALGNYKGDVFSTRRDIDDMNSDLDSTNTYNRMLSGKEPLDVVLDYNKKVENGKINRVDEFLKFYGNGSTQEGLKYIKKDLLTVDIGSQYISSGSKSLIQDALFTNSIVNSGVILNGEEHFNNVLKLTNRNQLIDVLNGDGTKNRNEDSDTVKHYKKIKKTKDDFIKYLEDGMSE